MHEIALRRRSGRCYPLRALGAGDVRGRPSRPPDRGPRAARRPARRTDVRFATPRPRHLGPGPVVGDPSTAIPERRSDRTNGCQAGLASRPRRAPGLALAGQLRDVAARHAAGRRRRAAIPDRGPQRLRQGLARDALPLVDQPDAGPDRRLQRPGRVHHRRGADAGRGGRDGATTARPMAPAVARGGNETRRSGSSRPGSAARAASTNINPRYTFANFIVGSANRLAHAASLSVAERPGHAYNPLFLYGGVGLGKTHLMHAIGNQVIARFPRKRVVYATSREVHERVHHAIQQGKIDEFRGALPTDRPAAHRRHPVHRRQGADPGGVLPHVQRHPRGRQADRPVVATGRRRRS